MRRIDIYKREYEDVKEIFEFDGSLEMAEDIKKYIDKNDNSNMISAHVVEDIHAKLDSSFVVIRTVEREDVVSGPATNVSYSMSSYKTYNRHELLVPGDILVITRGLERFGIVCISYLIIESGDADEYKIEDYESC